MVALGGEEERKGEEEESGGGKRGEGLGLEREEPVLDFYRRQGAGGVAWHGDGTMRAFAPAL